MEVELAGLLATELLHLCLAAARPELVVKSVEVLLVVQAWNPELRALFSKQGVALRQESLPRQQQPLPVV